MKDRPTPRPRKRHRRTRSATGQAGDRGDTVRKAPLVLPHRDPIPVAAPEQHGDTTGPEMPPPHAAPPRGRPVA